MFLGYLSDVSHPGTSATGTCLTVLGVRSPRSEIWQGRVLSKVQDSNSHVRVLYGSPHHPHSSSLCLSASFCVYMIAEDTDHSRLTTCLVPLCPQVVHL